MIRNKIIETHYRQNFPKLVKIIARRFGGDKGLAEEAVQEAYARALKYFKLFNPDVRPFEAWFSTILNNACSDLKKQEIHRGVIKDVEDIDAIPSEEDREKATHWKQLRKAIRREVDNIDNPLHEEVCDLYFLKGMSPTDIPSIVPNVTREAVFKIIQRFRYFLIDKYAMA